MTNIFGDKIFCSPSSSLQSEYPDENDDFQITETGMSTASTSTIGDKSQITVGSFASTFKKLLEGQTFDFDDLYDDYDEEMEEEMAEDESYVYSSSSYMPSYFGLGPGYNGILNPYEKHPIVNPVAVVEEIEPRFLPHDHEERLLNDKLNELASPGNAYSSLFSNIPNPLQLQLPPPPPPMTFQTYDDTYNPPSTLLQDILKYTQDQKEYAKYRYLDEEDDESENCDSAQAKQVTHSPKPSTSKGLSLKNSAYNALKNSEIGLKAGILKNMNTKPSSSHVTIPPSISSMEESFRKTIKFYMAESLNNELKETIKSAALEQPQTQEEASEEIRTLNCTQEILEFRLDDSGKPEQCETLQSIPEDNILELETKKDTAKYSTADSSCQTDLPVIDTPVDQKVKQSRAGTKSSGTLEACKKLSVDDDVEHKVETSEQSSKVKGSKGSSCWRIFRSGRGKTRKNNNDSASESD